MNKETQRLLIQAKGREKVLEVLEKHNTTFLSITQISRLSGVYWSACRNMLTELLLTGKVEGVRLGRSCGFRLITPSHSQSKTTVT